MGCRYVDFGPREMKWNPPVDAINLRLIVCTFMTSAAARLIQPYLAWGLMAFVWLAAL